MLVFNCFVCMFDWSLCSMCMLLALLFVCFCLSAGEAQVQDQMLGRAFCSCLFVCSLACLFVCLLAVVGLRACLLACLLACFLVCRLVCLFGNEISSRISKQVVMKLPQ